MNTHLVYGLRSMKEDEYKYIGKSSSGLERPKTHLTYSHNESVRIWVDELKSEGYFPIIDVIEECDENTIDDTERKWINYYVDQGNELFNIQRYLGRDIGKLKKEVDSEKELLINELNDIKLKRQIITDLGLLIKTRRKVLNITQKDLSEMVGITFKSISEIELNQRNPTLDTITKILDVLGYEINFTIKSIN